MSSLTPRRPLPAASPMSRKRTDMYKNLTIRARLVAALAAFSLLLLAVGATGLAGMARTHADLQVFHEERLAALGHLDSMMGLMLRSQLVVVRAAHADAAALPAAIVQVERDRDAASKLWQEYSANFVSDQEREMAERFEAAHEHFVLDALAPALVAAKAGDVESMRALVNGRVEQMFPKLRLELEKLIAYQLEHGKSHYLQADRSYATLRQLVTTLLVAGLALVIGIGFRLERGIRRPLERAIAAAQALARGDLAHPAGAAGHDETGRLLAALQEVRSSLAATVGNVRHSTVGIHAAAACIAEGGTELSRRVEEQAGALGQAAASMKELAQAVLRNADNARQVNLLAHNAAHLATRGGAAVFQAVERMGALSGSSARIAGIIGIIDMIASKAAEIAQGATTRAAGEGSDDCAALAAEVRGLARRAAAAALETRQVISCAMEQVHAAGMLVNHAGDTMGEMVQAVHRVSTLINEITAVSHEHSLVIGHAKQGLLQMDAAARQNVALFEQAAASAASMQRQALALAQSVAAIRLAAHAPTANKPHSHQISLVPQQSYC